jgi:heptosyltransferase-2
MQREFNNIIIRMPNWVGDLVMATPLLADLRNRYPQAKITAMVSSGLAPLIETDPNINEVYRFTRPSGWLKRSENRDVITILRNGKYDLGILTTNSFSSAWWFYRGQIEKRLGFSDNYRSWLLTHPIEFPANREQQHLVNTYKALLEPLGIERSTTPPRLYLSEYEQNQIKHLLESRGVGSDNILVGINPGAAYGSAKCWLPERFTASTKALLEDPRIRVVYFGDRNGASLVKEICRGFDERVIDLSGQTTLRQLVGLVEQCHAFLTNDSGPMHIASAVGTPLLALFGSTNDTATGPYGGGQVIHKRVPCSPCYKRECPIKGFPCMTSIKSEEVVHDLQAMIEGS